jgi:anti-sigma factor RsiW
MKLLPRREIACQQWTELITDYLEDALPRGLVKAIDRHLGACPHCTEYLAQMRRTIQITGHLDGQIKGEPPPPPIPGEMLDVLQRAFDDFHRSPWPAP